MPMRVVRMTAMIAVLTLTTVGCEDENKKLADMAERHLDRQAEQNRQLAQLQQAVAEGSRQRDLLEDERRGLAAQRRLAPIIAAAISSGALLLSCLLPLGLCWLLLRRPVEPADDQAVAEVLLEDLVADRPLLLARSNSDRTGRIPVDDDRPGLIDDAQSSNP